MRGPLLAQHSGQRPLLHLYADVHPVPRREFKYHMARIFVDDEIDLPIRFETYDWPSRPGESPVLMC